MAYRRRAGPTLQSQPRPSFLLVHDVPTRMHRPPTLRDVIPTLPTRHPAASNVGPCDGTEAYSRNIPFRMFATKGIKSPSSRWAKVNQFTFAPELEAGPSSYIHFLHRVFHIFRSHLSMSCYSSRTMDRLIASEPGHTTRSIRPAMKRWLSAPAVSPSAGAIFSDHDSDNVSVYTAHVVKKTNNFLTTACTCTLSWFTDWYSYLQ